MIGRIEESKPSEGGASNPSAEKNIRVSGSKRRMKRPKITTVLFKLFLASLSARAIEGLPYSLDEVEHRVEYLYRFTNA